MEINLEEVWFDMRGDGMPALKLIGDTSKAKSPRKWSARDKARLLSNSYSPFRLSIKRDENG
jgi:hypothetical protein